MRIQSSIIVLAGLVLLSGCVRRTVINRPGWKDPATGKLMYVTPNYQKTVEERTIWIWNPEFYKTRKSFKEVEADNGY